MGKIVLGLGTSHTPLLTLAPGDWEHRAAADRANPKLNLSDGRWVNYQQLLAEVGPRWEKAARPEELQRKAALCEAGLEALAGALQAAQPDVALIVGDDQGELFGPANQPAFSIFHNDELDTSDLYGQSGQPQWVHAMGRGYMMDMRRRIQGHAGYAIKIIHGLMEVGVDVSSVAHIEEGSKAGLGHAFGFVVKRLFRGRALPVVPLMLNTYYPPNVPSAARCYDIGQALRRAVEADGTALRVAVIASGGLSHFVVDEALDRRVLQAIEQRDAKTLRSLPRGALNSGSSEILNWVLAAGALEHLPVQSARYVPIQRTPAGTGVGAGFVIWAPPSL